MLILIRRIYNVLVGSENIRCGTLPTSADTVACAAITLTAAAAWTWGAWVQVALGAVLTAETQIVGFTLENMVGAPSQGEVQIGYGVAPLGTELGRFQTVYANFVLPKPIRVLAATGIVARYRTSTGAADTVDIKLNTITGF